jgi:hypothetical protein
MLFQKMQFVVHSSFKDRGVIELCYILVCYYSIKRCFLELLIVGCFFVKKVINCVNTLVLLYFLTQLMCKIISVEKKTLKSCYS